MNSNTNRVRTRLNIAVKYHEQGYTKA